MTNLKEKTWSLYEAEKATGNADAAVTIGNVYTVLVMIDTGADMDEKEDWVYSVYLNIGRLAMNRYGLANLMEGPLWEIRMGLEEAMTKAGMLEADEEPEDEEEDLNTSTNWAEWELDHMIDRYMEDRMAYEV